VEKRQLEQALLNSKEDSQAKRVRSSDASTPLKKNAASIPSGGRGGHGKDAKAGPFKRTPTAVKKPTVRVGDKIYIDWDGLYEAKVIAQTGWVGWYKVLLVNEGKEYKMKLFGNEGKDKCIPWTKTLKPGEKTVADKKTESTMVPQKSKHMDGSASSSSLLSLAKVALGISKDKSAN